MKKFSYLLLSVLLLLGFTACSIENNNPEDKYSEFASEEYELDYYEKPVAETEFDIFADKTDEVTEEKTDAEKSSCYWLPVSYTSYHENGTVKNETKWEYDEYGFSKTITNNGQLWQYMIPEFDGNTLYLYFDENDHTQMHQYNFDDEGNLIECTYNSHSRDMYTVGEEGNVNKYLWLDDNGQILSEYVSEEKTNYYSNDTVGNYMMDEDTWYDVVSSDDRCNSIIASVWKTATFNSDGTVTTTLYYEGGQIGEIIIWKPVTKQGYLQNMVLNNDWDYGGTLELFYRGR